MRVKYNQKYVDYLNNNFAHQLTLSDFNKENLHPFLKSNKPIYLEIGPGKGKFILEMARKNPDINFVVCELNKTISGICLKKIDEASLDNVYLISCDFYKLAEVVEKEFFDGIFLNFSDPWPKKRHTKRRLTSDDFFKAYYKVLKMNHNIYLKTDNDKFYEFSYEQAVKFNYEFLYNNEDYKEDDEFDAYSEYEQKFIDKGTKIKRFIIKKVEGTLYEIK